ncbi:MAG: hypothetical protein IJD16_09845 [Desulfovibrio sp.]|nr:hypothetical protein [Desulfovibrio sp.]
MPLQETLIAPGWSPWAYATLFLTGTGLQAAAFLLQRRFWQYLGAALVLLCAAHDRDLTLAAGQGLALAFRADKKS